jgi:dissimilatory sulfite reductase (desulfoviridin) alpha/beta subunit
MSKGKSKLDFEELKSRGVVKLKDQDDFSIWVRLPCGFIEADKLSALADIAEEYGDGKFLFSSRKVPIIPHVHWSNVQIVKTKINALELGYDRCGASIRNADICHHPDLCPFAIINPTILGQKVDQFWNYPINHKVKISISACLKQCDSPLALSDIGFIGVNHNGNASYDVYLGGKLGLDPLKGIKIASNINEEQGIRLIKNYLDYLQQNGIKGERSAHLIRRLGIEKLKKILTDDLSSLPDVPTSFCIKAFDNIGEMNKDSLKIKIISGEAEANQIRKIAELSKKYGIGLIHFTIRGSPEIVSFNKEKYVPIKRELNEVGLELLENGIANMQSCFGNYCTNTLANAQEVLEKVDRLVKELNINNPNIKIAASGCPNSCGLPLISNLGFIGVTKPELKPELCTGCKLCEKACKVNAITVEGEKDVKIDREKCKLCGNCIENCVFDALFKQEQGIALTIGGNSGEFTEIGTRITDVIDEKKALEITKNYLLLVKDEKEPVNSIFKDKNLDEIRKMLKIN